MSEAAADAEVRADVFEFRFIRKRQVHASIPRSRDFAEACIERSRNAQQAHASTGSP